MILKPAGDIGAHEQLTTVVAAVLATVTMGGEIVPHKALLDLGRDLAGDADADDSGLDRADPDAALQTRACADETKSGLVEQSSSHLLGGGETQRVG